MEEILNRKELKKYFENADHVDYKFFEGKTTLRPFIAAMLSYYPWWIVLLYKIRELLVSVLGLEKHAAPETLPCLQPQDISFTPGEAVTFFTVRSAKEATYWIAETPEDKHLAAYFGVFSEPLEGGSMRFFLVTSVYYKHWTGPFYFNLIRPFHHLVVRQMGRAGLRTGE
jgi:hypothetical protein